MRLPVGVDAHLQRAADLDLIPAVDLRRQGGIDHVPLAQSDVVLGQDVGDRARLRADLRRDAVLDERHGLGVQQPRNRRGAQRRAQRQHERQRQAERAHRGRKAAHDAKAVDAQRRAQVRRAHEEGGRLPEKPGQGVGDGVQAARKPVPNFQARGPLALRALPSAGRISLPRTEIVHCIASLSIWVAGVLPSGHIVRDLRLPVKFPRAKKAVFPQKTGFFATFLRAAPPGRRTAPGNKIPANSFFTERAFSVIIDHMPTFCDDLRGYA